MFRKVLFSVAAFAVMLSLVSTSFAEEWKITSLNWQPYSGAEMSNQGNSIQKLRSVLEKAGISLSVEFYPWKRAQQKAGTAEYVGYFPAWPEEVTAGFIASEPVDKSTLGVMKNEAVTLTWNSVEDLFKNYKVGVIKTYVYPDAVNAAMAKYPQNVDNTPDEVSLLRKLSSHRIDIALTDPAVMQYLAQQEGVSNVVPDEKIIEEKPLVIAFREGADNQARIDKLNSLVQ